MPVKNAALPTNGDVKVFLTALGVTLSLRSLHGSASVSELSILSCTASTAYGRIAKPLQQARGRIESLVRDHWCLLSQ